MEKFNEGDRVRVIISNPQDPDHRFNRKTGEITNVFKDRLSGITDDPRHDYLYTVEFDDDGFGKMDFRYDDLDPL